MTATPAAVAAFRDGLAFESLPSPTFRDNHKCGLSVGAKVYEWDFAEFGTVKAIGENMLVVSFRQHGSLKMDRQETERRLDLSPSR